jgi:hypothetical protein
MVHGKDNLACSSILLDKDRPQDFVTSHQLIKHVSKYISVQLTAQPKGHWLVVERILGVELVKEPKALLGEGQRDIVTVESSRNRRCKRDVAILFVNEVLEHL